eukprot:1563922-Pleurochrysis_carterae.AAC.1
MMWQTQATQRKWVWEVVCVCVLRASVASARAYERGACGESAYKQAVAHSLKTCACLSVSVFCGHAHNLRSRVPASWEARVLSSERARRAAA